LDSFVRAYGPLVFGTAWRILGNATDAEDVVQEVFLEAYRLQQRRAVRHWPGLLRRLAACRGLDTLRRRRSVRPLDGLSLEAGRDGPEGAAIGRELVERLRAAVSRLPNQEAAVFCLRYFEDLSNREIGEALNIRPGAVAVALHKARARLEALLGELIRGAYP
jgi:RNA polymerase sigma-70 factor (ECF subfamily)